MGYTIDDIVKEYLIEIGDNQMNRYARFYQIAVAGIREFHMDMTGTVQVAELTVGPNDTAALPIGYMNYTKIAVAGRDGELYALGRNDNISLVKHFDACGQEIRPEQVPPVNSFIGGPFLVGSNTANEYATHWRNGEFEGRFFGIGGGNNANGYFRINTTDNTIKFEDINCHAGPIIMEFIGDIEIENGDYQVHPFIIETLKGWIYWKSIQRDRSRTANEKEAAKLDYEQARRVSRRRIDSSPLSEWYAAIRSGNIGTAHF